MNGRTRSETSKRWPGNIGRRSRRFSRKVLTPLRAIRSGALIAYSVAQMAESEGADVDGLILYDMVNPAAVSPLPLVDRVKWIWEVRSELPPLRRLGSTLGRLGELGWWLCRHASVFIKLKTGRFSEPFSRQVRARFEHEKLVGTFQPHGFSGRVLLILTEDPGDKYRVGDRCGWEEAIEGALTCRLVSGNPSRSFPSPISTGSCGTPMNSSIRIPRGECRSRWSATRWSRWGATNYPIGATSWPNFPKPGNELVRYWLLAIRNLRLWLCTSFKSLQNWKRFAQIRGHSSPFAFQKFQNK